MKQKFFFIPICFFLTLILFGPRVQAQYSHFYQWGLLPQNKVDMLIGESSGDRAFHHIINMAGYNRPRDAEEYSTTLMESTYVVNKLKEYNLDGINIERLGKTLTWNGLSGTLYEVSPSFNKLADYEDLPLLLVSGSVTTDVEAPLVWVGDGSEQSIEGIDLSGKIALTSASPGRVHNTLVSKGALGLVSFYSPRPLVEPLMIPSTSLRQRGDQELTFAFLLPPREGHLIRDRLLRREKIVVRAKIESKTEELDIQVPTCVIPGTDPDAEEVIISAHIFEGYVKQGANDNISGSAAILEVARVIRTMIDDGRLEQPRRSIRFIWIPEFSGTIPWVKEHQDIMERTLCNINLDMVGLSLSENKSYFVLHRTSYGNAHYIGDVLENYYRYVGETNKMNSVVSGSKFYKRIVSPTGTDDPFYYQIENASGGSDHMVFNDWGVQVPGVLLITWPDPYYHTSEDRPWACDPTQLKRTVFITAASAYSIAAAEGALTLNIAGEVFGNASRRMGHQFSKAMDMIGKSSGDKLNSVLKRSLSDLSGTCLGEKLILESVLELEPGNDKLKALIKDYSSSIDNLNKDQKRTLISAASILAGSGNEKLTRIVLSDIEIEADKIIPFPTSYPTDLGYRGYSDIVREALSDSKLKNDYRASSLATEIGKLANGKLSLLDMKHIIDAQQSGETKIESLLEMVKILDNVRLIELK